MAKLKHTIINVRVVKIDNESEKFQLWVSYYGLHNH